MIVYDKSWWGDAVLVRMYGSAFPRALPYSLGACVLAAALSFFFKDELDEQFVAPYPFQTFAFIVGSLVVFRSQLSYNRYWEGRTQLQRMSSRLTDAVVLAVNFDRESVPKVNPTTQQVKDHQWFRDTIVHLASLMHGVALATLRTDYNMENLVAHDSLRHAPNFNVRNEMNRIDEDETDSASESISDPNPRRKGKATAEKTTKHAKKRPSPHRPLFSPSALQFSSTAPGKLPGAFTSHPDNMPIPAKSDKAYQGEAPASSVNYLLDYFVLRVDKARDAAIASFMKLPVIGGLTQAEGVALGAYVSSGGGVQAVPDMKQGIHGVFLDDGTYAPAPTERVHSCLAWTQQAVIERIHAGGCKAPPPVQSVIQGVLSDCMNSFEQCKKLVDTPFPFPWAQAMCVLVLYAAAAPFVIVAHTTNMWIAVAITFAAVQSHIMLNEASTDIEDPFHDDPNELPLPQIQYKFNERLLAIAHTNRPVSFTDVGEIKGPGNKIQFCSSTPNSKGKAQPVPESVQNGEANQNSFYAKDMPAAPNQAMLPQLSPRSPGTTDYDGAMSLPSSIAPPKTGVPYIDKHELRYGAAYGTAEEATFMTSGVIKSTSSLSVPPLDTTGNASRTYWAATQTQLGSLADGGEPSTHARSRHGPVPSSDSDFLQYSARHQLPPAADNAASLHSMRWEPSVRGGQRGNSRRGSRYSQRAGGSRRSALAPRPAQYKAQMGRPGGSKHLVVDMNPEDDRRAALGSESPPAPSQAEQAKAAGVSTKRASAWSSRKLDQSPEAPRAASRHFGGSSGAVELSDNSGGSPVARLGSRHASKRPFGANGKDVADVSASTSLPHIRPSPAVEKANLSKAFDILLGKEGASTAQPGTHVTQPQPSQPLRNSSGTARPMTYSKTFTPGERRASKGADTQQVAKRAAHVSATTHSGSGTESVSTSAPGDNKREMSFRNAIADLDGIVKNADPEDAGSDSTGGRSEDDILPLMNRSQWPRVLREDTDSRGDGSSSDQRHAAPARGSSPTPVPQPSKAAARHTVGDALSPSRRQQASPRDNFDSRDSPHSPNMKRRSASQVLGQQRRRSGSSPDIYAAGNQSMDWRPPSRPAVKHPVDRTYMSSATDQSGSSKGDDTHGDNAAHVSLMGQASAYITGSRSGTERAVRAGRARGQQALAEYDKHAHATNVLPSVRSTSDGLTDTPLNTGMAPLAGATRGSSPRQGRY